MRNYGEHVAITAGLDHTDADHTLIMACDLQDDPAAIPAIVDAARTTGADLVLTRRLQRQDPLLKRLLARIFYAVVQFFVKVRYDHRVGNYRGLSRRGVHYFREYRERTRNVNAIMAIMRVPTTTIDVQHQAAGRRHERLLDLPLRPARLPRAGRLLRGAAAARGDPRRHGDRAGPGPPRLAGLGRPPTPIGRCRRSPPARRCWR